MPTEFQAEHSNGIFLQFELFFELFFEIFFEINVAGELFVAFFVVAVADNSNWINCFDV